MADRDERHRARIEAERRRRHASGPAARHQRAVRRRNVALVVAGVVVLAVAGVAISRRDAGPASPDETISLGRAGSVEVRGAPDVVVGPGPSSYRIVYRVEDAGPTVGYRTDVVSVRRPWSSRLESRRGKPPGDSALSTQVATFGQRLTQSSDADKPVVLELGPGVPASDLRLATVLAPAEAAGRVQRREVREVAGRRCQVFRAADYLTSTELRPPADDLYADSCVDESGLVLEEVLVEDGKAIARRVAVSVDEAPTLADDLFPTGTPNVRAAQGGGSLRRLVDGTVPPGPFFVADAVPEGFVFEGRYSLVPPQAENFGDDLSRQGYRRAGVVDVWVRGDDLLVLEQGATLQGAPPFEVDPTNPTVDLGPFGTAEIHFSGLGNQVRAARDGGRYVSAIGTLPPDGLVAVLRSLREVPGGELVYADGEG